MPEIFNISVLLIFSYLIGAIPTSIWTGKIFFGIDIREHGSGNAGATNVMRVLGLKAGIPVLLFDIFKGWAAVQLIYLFPALGNDSETFINLRIISGICAVLGHIYPVYAGFRGGKGVATIFGVLLALHPLSTISAAGIFILSLIVTKYVSVSSMLAGLSFPFWIIFVYASPFLYLKIFSVITAVLLIITHKKNIKKLINGEENKATFLFRKNAINNK